jgi:hypothetical protein
VSELLARLVGWVAVTLVATTVRLLLFAVRLALWLFALAGFRGLRLLALAATVAGVRWAAATVGTGPAVRLAAIGWAAWALRHHRAAIRRNAAVRRATLALERYAAELGAAAKRLQPPRPRPTKPRPGPAPTVVTVAPPPGGTPGLPPPLAFEPSRLEALARYVADRWGIRPHPTAPSPHTALLGRKEPR